MYSTDCELAIREGKSAELYKISRLSKWSPGCMGEVMLFTVIKFLGVCRFCNIWLVISVQGLPFKFRAVPALIRIRHRSRPWATSKNSTTSSIWEVNWWTNFSGSTDPYVGLYSSNLVLSSSSASNLEHSREYDDMTSFVTHENGHNFQLKKEKEIIYFSTFIFYE